MYARPQEVDPELARHREADALSFAVSGALWRSSLVMYDRETRSLWSQVQGRAIAGPLEGEKLEELPSQVTTWAAWRARHPDTQVMVKPPLEHGAYRSYHGNSSWIGLLPSRNPDKRLPGKALVLGLERGQAHAALPLDLLAEQGVLHAGGLGTELVVFSPPGERTAALAWEARLDGEPLRFETEARETEAGETEAGNGGLAVRDLETGSSWSWQSGCATEGELAGRCLEHVESTLVYWAIWARHHPETEILEPAP